MVVILLLMRMEVAAAMIGDGKPSLIQILEE
jgi:hypothetical protein